MIILFHSRHDQVSIAHRLELEVSLRRAEAAGWNVPDSKPKRSKVADEDRVPTDLLFSPFPFCERQVWNRQAAQTLLQSCNDHIERLQENDKDYPDDFTVSLGEQS